MKHLAEKKTVAGFAGGTPVEGRRSSRFPATS